MPAQFPFWSGPDFHPVHGALNVALHTWNNPERRHAAEKLARVFVTISRQPGAGGVPLAQRLAERLNAHAPGDWTAWDQELVEKVSAEHHLNKGTIETVIDRPHTWLSDLVSGFSQDVTPSDLVVYKKVAGTIRALATAGHAILVGRGGQFIIAGLTGGVHLRLVAPLEYRIKTTAESFNLSQRGRRTPHGNRADPQRLLSRVLARQITRSAELHDDPEFRRAIAGRNGRLRSADRPPPRPRGVGIARGIRDDGAGLKRIRAASASVDPPTTDYPSTFTRTGTFDWIFSTIFSAMMVNFTSNGFASSQREKPLWKGPRSTIV